MVALTVAGPRQHDLQAVQGVGRCWECSSDQHMRSECPVYKKRVEAAEGDKPKEEPKGKKKGKDGKGKGKDPAKDPKTPCPGDPEKGKGKEGPRKRGSCFLCGSTEHPLKKPKVATATAEAPGSDPAASSASAPVLGARRLSSLMRPLKPLRCCEVSG